MRLLITIAFVVFALGTFALGYFRGYSAHSCTSAAFRLRVDESLWHQIGEGDLDRARESIRACIYSDAKAYRAATSSPLQHFASVYRQSHIGDIAQALREADTITEGMTFDTHDVITR